MLGGEIALALMQDRVNNGLSALPTNVSRSHQKRTSVMLQNRQQPKRASLQAPMGEPAVAEEVECASNPPLPDGWTEHEGEDGNCYYFNAKQNLTQWTHPALGEDEEIVVDLLDPSMIFSLERTTLSGYNQATTLMLIGGGIMTVKNAVQARNNDDGKASVDMGLGFMFAGIAMAAGTWWLHLRRMHVLKHGLRNHVFFNWQWSSIVWMSFLGGMITMGFFIEIYFAMRYPYFDRLRAVEIATPSPTPTP
jgi:hypothetical protein